MKAYMSLLFLMISSPVMAETVGSLSDVTGTNYNYDSQTKIYWLDLTETVNMSYTEIKAQMASGGRLEGWQIAGRGDIDVLFSNMTDGMYAKSNKYSLLPSLDLGPNAQEILSKSISIFSPTSEKPAKKGIAAYKKTMGFYSSGRTSAKISQFYGAGDRFPSDFSKVIRNGPAKEKHIGWFLGRNTQP